MKILGTGLSGLVGSRVVELLKDRYQFENLSRETGVDITKEDLVAKKVGDSKAEVILHMAAKTDVDGCEQDKALGEKGEAWQVNVLGTRNIVEAAKKHHKKILLISTDFVFDGKLAQGVYRENDKAHPINWYGKTKYEAEKLVVNCGLPCIIARIAYPYRRQFKLKRDFMRAIKERLAKGEFMHAVVDQIMTPTFIDDIAASLALLLQKNVEGIYHVVGGGYISPYEAALAIASVFGYNRSLISQTTREAYFQNKAPRAFSLALNNDKITKLGVVMKTFREGLHEIKKQII